MSVQFSDLVVCLVMFSDRKTTKNTSKSTDDDDKSDGDQTQYHEFDEHPMHSTIQSVLFDLKAEEKAKKPRSKNYRRPQNPVVHDCKQSIITENRKATKKYYSFTGLLVFYLLVCG